MVAPVVMVSSSGCACTSSSRRAAAGAVMATTLVRRRSAARLDLAGLLVDVEHARVRVLVGGGDHALVLGRGDVGAGDREVAVREVARLLLLEVRNHRAALLALRVVEH